MAYPRPERRSLYLISMVTATGCAGLSLLLQFIGFVTPGWIVLSKPTGMAVNAGVWYIQVCIDSTCRTASMTRVVNPFNVADDAVSEFINWREVQVETTLAFVSCIVTVLISVNALVQRGQLPRAHLCWAAITAIISGGLLMIPIGRLLDIKLGWTSQFTSFDVPYSLVFTTIGCVFAFAAAVLDVIALCKLIILMRRQDGMEERVDLTLAPT